MCMEKVTKMIVHMRDSDELPGSAGHCGTLGERVNQWVEDLSHLIVAVPFK